MKEFDPLDYDNLTRHVVQELMVQPLVRMDKIPQFHGAGVYALFYKGSCPYYAPISGSGTPIYVGKAVPPGARKGLVHSGASLVLCKRLQEHAKSISDADNLEVSDFEVRYLVVVNTWIVMAEQFLIRNFNPIWNSCIDGFGLHDPGKNRPGQLSAWDTLHPGRTAKWSAEPKPGKPLDELISTLGKFLKKQASQQDQAQQQLQ